MARDSQFGASGDSATDGTVLCQMILPVSSQYRDLSREDDRPIAQAPAAQAIWGRASVCRCTLQLVQWDPAAPPQFTLTGAIRESRQELAVSQDAAPLLD